MKKINQKTIRVLAIESSCDETSASVIEAKLKIKNLKLKILSNVISSQVKLHARYGGVYPELASREHIKNIIPVIEQTLFEANSKFKFEIFNETHLSIPLEVKNSNFKTLNHLNLIKNCKLIIENYIDAIAVTTGPGLIGSLLVGVNTAKTMAYALKKPIYAINHLEGHIYSCFARANSKFKFKIFNETQNSNFKTLNHLNLIKNCKLKIKNLIPQFPLVALVVSGGHTSLVYIKNHFDYQVIGETLDDAAGEAFDKVAKLLGLGYPGGPAISRMAETNSKFKFEICNQIQNSNVLKLDHWNLNKNLKLKIKNSFHFPRPMIDSPNFDFSFSGLKTSVLYTVNKLKSQNSNLKTTTKSSKLKDEIVQLICKEFQEAVIDTLVTKTLRAAEKYKVKSILLCGGVSANSRLREEFARRLDLRTTSFTYEVFEDFTSQVARKSDDKQLAISHKLDFFVPQKNLTSDNAAMIGIAAAYRIALGKNDNTDWEMINADPNLRLK